MRPVSAAWRNTFSFAAVQDTDRNESEGLHTHIGFLLSQTDLPPVFQEGILFQGHYHLLGLRARNRKKLVIFPTVERDEGKTEGGEIRSP